GHEVVGVDVNPTKVDLMARGQAPVVEERIGELTAEVVGSGALRATTDVVAAVAASEISLICVGTPSAANGSLSTMYLERVAEMTKYADNPFHGLKIAFATELGAICHALGVDSHKVMDVFLADRKLNVSPAYLRPGFAFGGSCLPKDLRGLVYAARRADVSVPLLSHVLPSNEEHLRRAFELVTSSGRRRIGLFGLS